MVAAESVLGELVVLESAALLQEANVTAESSRKNKLRMGLICAKIGKRGILMSTGIFVSRLIAHKLRPVLFQVSDNCKTNIR